MSDSDNSPQIDFYILDAGDHRDRLRFACRLIDKAYRLGHRIYVQADSTDAEREMDDLLWTFAQGSFVPHGRVSSLEDGNEPNVLIGPIPDQSVRKGMLVNITEDPCEEMHGWTRIAEIVGADDVSRQNGRRRFKHYRDAAIEPQIHNIQV